MLNFKAFYLFVNEGFVNDTSPYCDLHLTVLTYFRFIHPQLDKYNWHHTSKTAFPSRQRAFFHTAHCDIFCDIPHYTVNSIFINVYCDFACIFQIMEIIGR